MMVVFRVAEEERTFCLFCCLTRYVFGIVKCKTKSKAKQLKKFNRITHIARKIIRFHFSVLNVYKRENNTTVLHVLNVYIHIQ